MFKPFFQKPRKGIRASAYRRLALSGGVEFGEAKNVAAKMRDDVEEGHFTVFAVQGIEAKRFVIKLDNLRNPAFLSLLEQAREEYGFQQKGALNLPCRPQQLQQILEERYRENAAAESWPAFDASIIEGY